MAARASVLLKGFVKHGLQDTLFRGGVVAVATRAIGVRHSKPHVRLRKPGRIPFMTPRTDHGPVPDEQPFHIRCVRIVTDRTVACLYLGMNVFPRHHLLLVMTVETPLAARFLYKGRVFRRVRIVTHQAPALLNGPVHDTAREIPATVVTPVAELAACEVKESGEPGGVGIVAHGAHPVPDGFMYIRPCKVLHVLVALDAKGPRVLPRPRADLPHAEGKGKDQSGQ